MRNTPSNWEAMFTAMSYAQKLPPDAEFVILHYLEHPLSRITLSVDARTALEARLLREALGGGEWDIRSDTLAEGRVRTVWTQHPRGIVLRITRYEESSNALREALA